MIVHYDEGVDALHLKLGDQKPDGVIEIAGNIDTTEDGKLTKQAGFFWEDQSANEHK